MHSYILAGMLPLQTQWHSSNFVYAYWVQWYLQFAVQSVLYSCWSGLYLIPWISPLLYDQSISLVHSINYTALLSVQEWLVKYPLNCKASNWSNAFVLQIFGTHVATNYVHVHDFVYYLYITCMCMLYNYITSSSRISLWLHKIEVEC